MADNSNAEMRVLLANVEMRQEFNGSGQPLYVGTAKPGTTPSQGKWAIKKFLYDGSSRQIAITWADNTGHEVKVWDDRATYTYQTS